MSNRRSVASQRPTTTFCWLPPESPSIARAGSFGRRSSEAPSRIAFLASMRGEAGKKRCGQTPPD